MGPHVAQLALQFSATISADMIEENVAATVALSYREIKRLFRMPV
jgi:transcriptional regulator GlxA family with amidase domain